MKSERVRETLGVENIKARYRRSLFRWFGHIERRDNTEQESDKYGAIGKKEERKSKEEME